MPTYRGGAYLVEALESALQQTFTDFELLVCDNGASDEVQARCASYGDGRIHYSRNAENIGAYRNGLLGFSRAVGRYVAYLHDDDVWEPEYLERMVSPLESRPELSVAFCDHWVIRPDGRVDDAATRRWSTGSGRDRLRAGSHADVLRLAVIHQAILPAYAAVVRRSAVDLAALSPELDPVYDLPIAWQAARRGGGWYDPSRLTRYRHHPSSMTSNLDYSVAIINFYEKVLADPESARVHRATRRALAVARTRYGWALLEQGRRREARAWLRAAMLHSHSPRPHLAFVASALPLGPQAARFTRILVHRVRHARGLPV